MSENAKNSIVESAISLFNTKGFSGTSIREIARKANVNVAHISYYFQSKQGLLEYCFTTFFEGYLKEIEKGASSLNIGAAECLKLVTKSILQYQYRNIHLTRLVLREMSIDSQVVREIMSTYFVKEKYYFKMIFEEGIQTKEFRPLSVNYLIIQYKGMLSMPFLNSYYLSEVLHVFPYESYFVDKYLKEIYRWINSVLCNIEKKERPLPPLVVVK